MTKTGLNFKKVGKITLLASLTVLSSLFTINKTYAVDMSLPVPVSGEISGATIVYPAGTNSMVVNVEQPVAKINFSSYNIGETYSAIYNFTAPNQSVFNRVTGVNPSYIKGNITQQGYNGNVYLINPNGIIFSAGSKINVGCFMASTLNVSDSEISNFVANKTLTFERTAGAHPEGIVFENNVKINTSNGIMLSNGILMDPLWTPAANISYITNDGVTFTVKNDNFVNASPVMSYTPYTGTATKTSNYSNQKGFSVTNSKLEVLTVPTNTTSVLPASVLSLKLVTPTPLKLIGATQNNYLAGTNISVSSIGETSIVQNFNNNNSVPGFIALNNTNVPKLEHNNETTVAFSDLTPIGAAGKIQNAVNNSPKETYDMVIDKAILPDQE